MEMCISLGLSTESLYTVFVPNQSIWEKTANFPSFWERGSPHPTGAHMRCCPKEDLGCTGVEDKN